MIQISCSKEDLPVDERSLFNVWFVFSHIANNNWNSTIENQSLSTQEKVDEIMAEKIKLLKEVIWLDERKLLEMFYHDWWIKLTMEDIEEIIWSLFLVWEEIEWWKK